MEHKIEERDWFMKGKEIFHAFHQGQNMSWWSLSIIGCIGESKFYKGGGMDLKASYHEFMKKRSDLEELFKKPEPLERVIFKCNPDIPSHPMLFSYLVQMRDWVKADFHLLSFLIMTNIILFSMGKGDQKRR